MTERSRREREARVVAFFKAVRRGNINVVESFLKDRRFNANCHDTWENACFTALHYAIQKASWPLMESLLAYKDININITAESELSVFSFAVIHHRFEFIERLIKYVSQRPTDTQTTARIEQALLTAIQKKNMVAGTLLLKYLETLKPGAPGGANALKEASRCFQDFFLVLLHSPYVNFNGWTSDGYSFFARAIEDCKSMQLVAMCEKSNEHTLADMVVARRSPTMESPLGYLFNHTHLMWGTSQTNRLSTRFVYLVLSNPHVRERLRKDRQISNPLYWALSKQKSVCILHVIMMVGYKGIYMDGDFPERRGSGELNSYRLAMNTIQLLTALVSIPRLRHCSPLARLPLDLVKHMSKFIQFHPLSNENKEIIRDALTVRVLPVPKTIAV